MYVYIHIHTYIYVYYIYIYTYIYIYINKCICVYIKAKQTSTGRDKEIEDLRNQIKSLKQNETNILNQKTSRWPPSEEAIHKPTSFC